MEDSSVGYWGDLVVGTMFEFGQKFCEYLGGYFSNCVNFLTPDIYTVLNN